MSVENIVKKIVDESQAAARSIAEKAEQDMRKLNSELDREETELKGAATRKTQSEAEETVKRRVSSARLEGRKRILGEKDMIVGEVYAEARRRLLALPDDKYLDFLQRLAIAHSVEGDVKVMLSKKDITRFKGKLPQWEKDVAQAAQKQGKKGAVSVSSETREIEGGLVLSQGRTEVNLSLDVILDETKYNLEGEVTRILFGQ
jgi:V/A-type H+-transporting ATPase subunit E